MGYVADAVMWELGEEAVFLAVASVYRELKVQLYRLNLATMTWSDWGQVLGGGRHHGESSSVC